MPPLALPEPGTDPEAVADVGRRRAVLRARAGARPRTLTSARDNIDAIAEICRRVDGLPLAIELAAARCGLLSPAGDRRAPARRARRTRRRAARRARPPAHAARDDRLEPQLLSDDEKACFARFAVFAGGATVDAAETITGADIDTLDRLVAKSLLVRRPEAHGPTRLGMLETVRAYAAERFAAIPDCESVRERHFRYFLSLAQRHGPDWALDGPNRDEHLAALDGEIENLRAALQWASERDATGSRSSCPRH